MNGKWSVQTGKQKHTHTDAERSPASVGLAQAHSQATPRFYLTVVFSTAARQNLGVAWERG